MKAATMPALLFAGTGHTAMTEELILRENAQCA